MRINLDEIFRIMSDEAYEEERYRLYIKKKPKINKYKKYDEYARDMEEWKRQLDRHWERASKYTVNDIISIFFDNYDDYMPKRLYIAWRAVNRYEIRTCKCISAAMTRKLGDFIFNTESKTHYDMDDNKWRWNEEFYCEYH